MSVLNRATSRLQVSHQIEICLSSSCEGIRGSNVLLENLPPEIQTLILFELTSSQSLYSLIRVSPRYYQVFLLKKVEILSAIAIKQIHPHAYKYAMVAAIISQYPPSEPQGTLEPVIKQYWLQEVDDLKRTMPLNQSIFLCKTHANIEHFITDFAQQRLMALEQNSVLSTLATEVVDLTIDCQQKPLSSVEHGRLQRAFYYLELYGSVIRTPQLTRWQKRDMFTQILVHKEFPNPWKAEEVSCIQDYFYDHLSKVFDRVEDDFVRSSVVELDRASEDAYYGPKYLFPSISFLTRHAKLYEHRLYMEHMLTLGWDFLRSLIEADGEGLMNLIVQNARIDGLGNVLSNALTNVRRLQPVREVYERAICIALNGATVFEDRSDQRNEAWVWMISAADSPDLLNTAPGPAGLREWGYVFWDSSRLRSSGILLQNAVLVNAAYKRRRRCRELEPSAAERVDDMICRKIRHRRARTRSATVLATGSIMEL